MTLQNYHYWREMRDWTAPIGANTYHLHHHHPYHRPAGNTQHLLVGLLSSMDLPLLLLCRHPNLSGLAHKFDVQLLCLIGRSVLLIKWTLKYSTNMINTCYFSYHFSFLIHLILFLPSIFNVMSTQKNNVFSRCHFPFTWNSVPASSAVDKNSSTWVCSVMDWKLMRFQSCPSLISDVWSWNNGNIKPINTMVNQLQVLNKEKTTRDKYVYYRCVQISHLIFGLIYLKNANLYEKYTSVYLLW